MSVRHGNRVTTKRWLVFGVGIATSATAALLGACATDGSRPTLPPQEEERARVPDSGLDAAEAATEAVPCADCEYFPETCGPDVFCSNGPFDPSTAGGAFDVRTRVNVIRGRSANDVWVAGALGALAHFDGTSWARSDSGTQESMRALWLRDSDEITFLRLEFLYTRGIPVPDAGVSAGGWTRQEVASFPPSYESAYTFFESAWASPEADWLWAATRRSVYSQSTSGLWRLRRSPSGAFEVGEGAPENSFTGQMTAIHGSSPDVLWAVGLEGATVRITGAQEDTPSFEAFNSQTWDALFGVWAASESEAWAVGAQGTIRHYTGDPAFWDVVANVPTTANLNAVWGSSASDIWAVGDAGVVLRYDGTSWSRMKIAGLGARRPDLNTVWMPGPGHVWIGGHGVVLSLGGKP
jgi:hypothetical protein